MCYLARFNPTESKNTFAIYESSLAVATGQVWNSSWKGRPSSEQKIWYLCLVFLQEKYLSLVKKAKELRRIDDDRVIDKLVEAASQTDDSIVNEGTEQAMHHVAGYLARTTINTHTCQPCQDLLVNREASHG